MQVLRWWQFRKKRQLKATESETTNLSRRGFLKVSFIAGVAVAMPTIVHDITKSLLPLIMGDGIHDDTAGIQAALSGKEFIARDECVTVFGGRVTLARGIFKTTKTLTLGASGTEVFGGGSIIQADYELGEMPVFSVGPDAKNVTLSGLHIQGNGIGPMISIERDLVDEIIGILINNQGNGIGPMISIERDLVDEIIGILINNQGTKL